MHKGRIGREAPSSKTLVSHLLPQFSYVTVLNQIVYQHETDLRPTQGKNMQLCIFKLVANRTNMLTRAPSSL